MTATKFIDVVCKKKNTRPRVCKLYRKLDVGCIFGDSNLSIHFVVVFRERNV